MALIKFYQWPALDEAALSLKTRQTQQICAKVTRLETEWCYYVETQDGRPLDDHQLRLVQSLLGRSVQLHSRFDAVGDTDAVVMEIGPRLNFCTAFSTNAVSVCRAVGLDSIRRLERSARYQLIAADRLQPEEELAVLDSLHDRMTEMRYTLPLTTFDHGITAEAWYTVDVLARGKAALDDVNRHLGLALDQWDIDYYYQLFAHQLKRNPTSVECFDLAQSNSEHSRHWFFKGRLTVDGRPLEGSLMDMIAATQATSRDNNVIRFSDNSSAIRGFSFDAVVPSKPGEPSPLEIKRVLRHITFTAETHNFPTGVSPFSGATTGTGGRIRDNQAVGRGGHVVAATVGYSFGQLLMADYALPWEDASLPYPANVARPVRVAVEASNGASDYGNKFGEPVLCGFARSFGLVVGQQRSEYVKPIMFSGGIGQVDDCYTNKMAPEVGMRVVKIGGPAYRIGVGGGAASSVHVQGGDDGRSQLDFGAVQRGDAEMEQKMNRLLRACIESLPDATPDANPICSIHDQGAGGNGNVLKEIVEPLGAVLHTCQFQVGDATLSTLELWGAEYQESNALLCRAEDVPRLLRVGRRERCPVAVVGRVTGDGRVVLCETADESGPHPVDLPLQQVLKDMPPKNFELQSHQVNHAPLDLHGVDVASALERVLRLPSVASKRYLTNKADRSVGGLVAQQQCVGALHTPLADVAVVALSPWGHNGGATAVGEQPVKGLVSAECGARFSLAEALTNLVWAPVSHLGDVKCSVNWMWPAKLPGQGAALVRACTALCDAMRHLGVAVDGGKDSLSMAVRVHQDVVQAPGTVVVSAYAPCPDVRLVVTPDLKLAAPPESEGAGRGSILLVDLSGGSARLGGSALAQCYRQVGDRVPDMEQPKLLVDAFNVTQQLINERKIASGHDISDGGLVVCLLEMAFAGVCGLDVDVAASPAAGVRRGDVLDVLFAEELGLVLEVDVDNEADVVRRYAELDVPCVRIGGTGPAGPDAQVRISVAGETVVEGRRSHWMRMWEETSYQLERLQTNVDCAVQEFESTVRRRGPTYDWTFDPDAAAPARGPAAKPRAAVLREEGTNGDREMAAALMAAGFDVWDVNTQDLLDGTTLEAFQGLVFAGGFSFGDVLGSARGWAASLLCRPAVRDQLRRFRRRSETFSLGVCNGCQLMALMGWVDPDQPSPSSQSDAEEGGSTSSTSTGIAADPAVWLDHNVSGRYESRFATVRVESCASVLLRGMDGTRTGVWVAHGEGRFAFARPDILERVEALGCVALRYVDDDGRPTTDYPMNPNGSANGIAGLCSADGRHLAMMPHPERCTRVWQMPWLPVGAGASGNSPWARLFDNAFEWCTTTASSS